MLRNYFENLENETLAPYALKSSNSVGRKYSRNEDPNRTCFQRDRDRVLHSKAFRRLKQKTQVVGVFSGDHFRTRLTHSLEVAQIGRQLARMLKLNEDVVETIALSHDLGHTPFGHVGESALNEMMSEYGGFEHNRQSRRVVELLEHRYPDHPGLNLSYEILDGLVKHKTPYDKVLVEPEDHTFISSIEAQIVNVADEIAYNNHDLDDGVSSGILKMETLYSQIELWKEAVDTIINKHPDATEFEVHKLGVSFLIGRQITDVYEQTKKNIKENKIKSFSDIAAFELADFSSEMKLKNSQLREHLYDKFYRHPRVEIMNRKGVFIVKELFKAYLDRPELLPTACIRHEEESHPRKISDYIASMTDNFAEQTYYALGRF